MFYLSQNYQKQFYTIIGDLLTLEKVVEEKNAEQDIKTKSANLTDRVQKLVHDLLQETSSYVTHIFMPEKKFGAEYAIQVLTGHQHRLMQKIESCPNKDTVYQLHRVSFYNNQEMPAVNLEKGEIKVSFYNILTRFYDAQLLLKKHMAGETSAEKYLWEKRKNPLVDLIRTDLPDVMGFCEATLSQVRDLREMTRQYGYSIASFYSDTGKTIIEEELSINVFKELFKQGEFVGVLYKNERCTLQDIVCHPLPRGKTYHRILVEARFIDHITQKIFTVLASHFDHESLESVQQSGRQERKIIRQLEREKIAWFSMGDRNWWHSPEWPLGADETLARSYALRPYICDIRDESEQGHFGPFGTYPSYNKTGDDSYPVIQIADTKVLYAQTLDVGFRSRNYTTGVYSYTLTGEFSPTTHTLITSPSESRIEERNFASDHFYIGTVARIN